MSRATLALGLLVVLGGIGLLGPSVPPQAPAPPKRASQAPGGLHAVPGAAARIVMT